MDGSPACGDNRAASGFVSKKLVFPAIPALPRAGLAGSVAALRVGIDNENNQAT